jgi:formate dehydrogenase gamma subunit
MSEAMLATPGERIRRFSTAQIAEHWVQVVAFVVLAVTGLPQRYSGAALSKSLIDGLGGIEAVRIVHRVSATILMLAVVYHVGAFGYRRYVTGRSQQMLPKKGDLRALVGSVRHTLGFQQDPPAQGRFTWEEKVEYWSLVWGTVLMIVTGFLLWNPIATTSVLPGDFIPAAKAAHSGEALLAVLAVVVWHVYHVHIRDLNMSMFTGFMSREEMADEHPLELEAIDSGEAPGITDPEEIARRSRRFYPAFGTIAVGLLIGIWVFVAFEETAITTIAPIEAPTIFAPVETTSTTGGVSTTVTAAPTTTVVAAEVTWDGVVGAFFEPACTGCHGSAVQTSGLDLSSFAGAVAGGNRGGGVVPGDPDGSVIVQIMEAGGHPAQLSAEDLGALRDWIASGAAER